MTPLQKALLIALLAILSWAIVVFLFLEIRNPWWVSELIRGVYWWVWG